MRCLRSKWQIAVLSGVLLPVTLFAGSLQLEFPGVESIGSDAISVEEAVAIANLVAADSWGSAKGGTPLLCSDVFGALNYYIVPFRRDGEDFPPKDDLLQKREEGVERTRQLLREFSPQYSGSQGIETLTASEDQSGDYQPPSLAPELVQRPDGSTSHRVLYRRACESLAREIESLTEDNLYGAIVVSATKNSYPVAAILDYLPPFYITGLEAKGIASDILGTEKCVLQSIVFLTPAHVYYKIGTPGDYVLIHWKTLSAIQDGESFFQRMRTAYCASPDAVMSDESAEYGLAVAEAWASLEQRLR
jgi:hypothetical protein